jgi:hypothetical protein
MISIGDNPGDMFNGGTIGSSIIPCHATASARCSASSSSKSSPPTRQENLDPDECGEEEIGCFNGARVVVTTIGDVSFSHCPREANKVAS